MQTCYKVALSTRKEYSLGGTTVILRRSPWCRHASYKVALSTRNDDDDDNDVVYTELMDYTRVCKL